MTPFIRKHSAKIAPFIRKLLQQQLLVYRWNVVVAVLLVVVGPAARPAVNSICFVNPLNAELNSICHLLILLEDLTFMCKCIVSLSNKMQRYTVYLYLETALHVSGGTSNHHQERM
jgi:hypothetical protein